MPTDFVVGPQRAVDGELFASAADRQAGALGTGEAWDGGLWGAGAGSRSPNEPLLTVLEPPGLAARRLPGAGRAAPSTARPPPGFRARRCSSHATPRPRCDLCADRCERGRQHARGSRVAASAFTASLCTLRQGGNLGQTSYKTTFGECGVKFFSALRPKRSDMLPEWPRLSTWGSSGWGAGWGAGHWRAASPAEIPSGCLGSRAGHQPTYGDALRRGVGECDIPLPLCCPATCVTQGERTA